MRLDFLGVLKDLRKPGSATGRERPFPSRRGRKYPALVRPLLPMGFALRPDGIFSGQNVAKRVRSPRKLPVVPLLEETVLP